MNDPKPKSALALWTRKIGLCPQVAAALTGLGFDVRPAGERSFRESFLDTEDGLLFRSGVALRLCEGEAEAVLSLEPLSDADAGSLAEQRLEKPIEAFPASIPAGAIRERLSPLGREISVDVRLRLDRTHVTHRATTSDGLTVDVECRTVRVGTEPSQESFSELVLSTSEPSAKLKVLASPLSAQFGLVPVERHTLIRALEAAGMAAPALVEGPELTLLAEDRFVDAAHRVLRRQLRRMLWHEDGTRLGLDPENLHDMRVASRRLRAALACFSEALPAGRVGALRQNLRWVGRALGNVRDLDVHLRRLDEDGRELAGELQEAVEMYRKFLLARRQKARAALLGALRTRRYAGFVDGFDHLLESGAPRRSKAALAAKRAKTVAGEIIRKRLKKVLRDGRTLTNESPDADLHRLRIRCKRLRYACEFFADLFGPDCAKFAVRVTEIQDVLGDQHDAVVAGETLAKFAREMRVPRAARRQVFMALGHLMAQQAQRARGARTEFAKLWKRFHKKKVRKALVAVLEPPRKTTPPAPKPPVSA